MTTREEMKEACPDVIPGKRRALEAVPDIWIAMWLSRDILTPSERRRLEAEKARRKSSVREHAIGVLVAREGPTPMQLATVVDQLHKLGATHVHHGGLPSKLHNAAREIGVTHHRDGIPFSEERLRGVIRDSDEVIAAPRETMEQTYATPGIWSLIGYAVHRSVPVAVVLPSGSVIRR